MLNIYYYFFTDIRITLDKKSKKYYTWNEEKYDYEEQEALFNLIQVLNDEIEVIESELNKYSEYLEEYREVLEVIQINERNERNEKR